MINDAKIHDIAVGYVRKSVLSSILSCIIVGTRHPSLAPYLQLDEGELVLVSAFFSKTNWYAFTTRRIVSQFQGILQSIEPSPGIVADFPNFKGYEFPESDEDWGKPGVVRRDVAMIRAANSDSTVQFQYETWETAMAPMYAVKYWQIKHPFLDKLMTSEELYNYKTARALQNGA